MEDPVSLPNPYGSRRGDICFEATAVSGFVARGVDPITERKGWARYDRDSEDHAAGDIEFLVQHGWMSVACAAWRDRHAVPVRIENLSGHGERPDADETLDLDPADTVADVKAKISAFCKVPPESKIFGCCMSSTTSFLTLGTDDWTVWGRFKSTRCLTCCRGQPSV
jgi:hypothetical protein